MLKHIHKIVGLMCAIVLLTACNDNAKGAFIEGEGVGNEPAKLLEISIAPDGIVYSGDSELSVAVGESQGFFAIGKYSDETTADITRLVTWSVADEEIGMIAPGGIFTGTLIGETLIQATKSDIESNQVSINVHEAAISRIQLTPSVTSLMVGGEQSLTATAIYNDGTSANITDKVSWNVESPNVASVIGGLVSADSVGVTGITAEAQEVTSNAVSITVNEADVVGLVLSPASITVPAGFQREIRATARYSDGTNTDVTGLVAWDVIDEDILEMRVGGIMQSISSGQTSLTAAFAGHVSNAVNVTVTDAEVTAIQITPSLQVIPKGNTIEYSARANLSDGTSSDISSDVEWHVANPAIGTITDNGTFFGLTIGSTNVSASYDDVTSNFAEAIVNDARVTDIQLTPVTVDAPIGTTYQFTATATFTDGTNRDITNSGAWVSSDMDIAAISPSGEVEAVTEGTSSITVSRDGVTSNVATVNVTDAVLTAVELRPQAIVLPRGMTIELTALGYYSDNTSVDITNIVDWHIEDPSYISVQNAVVSADEVGVTTLMAKKEGISSNTVDVTVNNAVVIDISVQPDSLSIPKGISDSVTATGTFSDNTVADITGAVAWEIGDTDIATVRLGTIDGVQIGETTLVARKDGVNSNTVAVTVTDAILTSILLEHSPLRTFLGKVEFITATGSYSDGSEADLTEQVNYQGHDTEIVTIIDGEVTTDSRRGETDVIAALDGLTSNQLRIVVSDVSQNALDTRDAAENGKLYTNPPSQLYVNSGNFQGLDSFGSISAQQGVLENNTFVAFSHRDAVRWCEFLAGNNFNDRDNWRMPTRFEFIDDMIALANNNSVYDLFFWFSFSPTWTITPAEEDPSFYANGGSLPTDLTDYFEWISLRGGENEPNDYINAGSASNRRGISCVSDP